MSQENVEDEVCCPVFHPEKWDNRILEWNNKRFVKDKVFTLFHIPINFGSVMRGMDSKIREAGAEIQEGLGLSDHTSKWNMDILVAVDKEVPGLDNITLSGKFLCKVYEGKYSETGKWCKDYEDYANEQNLKIKKWFMWYTTCPKCAKKYGKNYVAIIGEVE